MSEKFPSVLTAKKTETIEVDITVIKQELDTIEKKLDQTQKYSSDGLTAVVAALNQIKGEFDELKRTQPKVYEQKDKFKFYLEKDDDFFADKSFEHIKREGQKIQAEYWHSAEERLGNRFSSPYGEGWLGSAVSPLIRVMCYEPEYHFHNTICLGGRMKLDGYGWNSILYHELDGDVLIDNNGWGMQTNSPVSIYVEPTTVVNGVTIRPFEQQICNIICVSMNGGLPVYMGMDQDRFLMYNVNIQQHQGSTVGVKHGPVLKAPWYKVEQVTEGRHVALPDPRFINLQMEGPFSNKRKQAAMLLSGTNGTISNLNMHGFTCGPIIFSDHYWNINGITAHNGKKANGIQFVPDDQILLYCISQVGEKKRSAINGACPAFDGWYLPKRSTAPETKGFYQKGEVII